MKSKNVKAKVKNAAKSMARVAGEVIGSIGHEIVAGKEKIIEVAQSAVKKINKLKKAVKKKPLKKAVVKKAVIKKLATAKKRTKKTAKKVTWKATK